MRICAGGNELTRSAKQGKRLKGRAGMTLVELLGVMVVLAILAAIAVGGVMSAQRKARETQILTALDAYKSAFTTSCINYPGMVSDRTKNWGTDGSTYSTQQALKKVVDRMNDVLDDELRMYWDNTLGYYQSQGFDAFGGRYVLLEYPESADGATTYYACGEGDPGFGRLGLSVWTTGTTDSVVTDKIVGKDTYGIAMYFTGGLVTSSYQNINGESAFTGWTTRIQP